MGTPYGGDDGTSRSLEHMRAGPGDPAPTRQPIVATRVVMRMWASQPFTVESQLEGETTWRHVNAFADEHRARAAADWLLKGEQVTHTFGTPTPTPTQENPDNGNEATRVDEGPQPRGENLPDGQNQ